MQQLSQQLRQAQSAAQQARQDAQRLEQSQRVNGALEASQQRLGQQSGVSEGQGQGQQGQQGQAQGQGAGQGQGHGQGQGQAVTQGNPASRAGNGHTWEDEGTYDSNGSHQDANRNTSRTTGQDIDDFEQFYAPVRMDGAETLTAGVDGTIDEDGHVDELPSRLTGSTERSEGTLLSVPDQYREAADQALNAERVPPGYRDVVKRYFDAME